MSDGLSKGGGALHSFTIALFGKRWLCDPLVDLLRNDERVHDAGIAWRSDATELVRLTERHRDVAVALLFWPDDDVEALIGVVDAVRARQANPLMLVLVRCLAPLAPYQRRRVDAAGIHAAAFRPGDDDARLLDDIVFAVRAMHEKQALVELSEFGSGWHGTDSLTDLAAAALHFLHRHGIGLQGGLFFFRRPTTAPAWIALVGTGQFGGIACTEAAALEIPQRDAILAALAAEQACPTEQAVSLQVSSPDGEHACLYLLHDGALSPWHRVVIQVFRRRLATTLDEVLSKLRQERLRHVTITTLATLAEYRDVDTGAHVSRVARLTAGVAAVLGAGDAGATALLRHIGQASVLHDIGKVGIPDQILLKAGPLDAAERTAIERHAVLGSEILRKTSTISDAPAVMLLAAEIARSHHEKFDGSGYPDQLAGEAIPLAARIVAVVDVYDALTTERPYKQPWPEEQAIDFICAQSGRHFDPRVVEAFLTVVEHKRHGQIATWSDHFSVNHAAIDDDHRKLFDILNQIWTARSAANRQVLEMALDDLTYYTAMHFEREEAYMRSFGYPRHDEHRAAHEGFTGRIEALRWEYLYGARSDVNADLLNYLAEWLVSHIGHADRLYRDFLHGLGRSAPEAALAPA